MKTDSQNNLLTSRRSSWSSEGVHPTTDLRHALPNRGLLISELDFRLAHRKEEENRAAETFSFSDKIKDVFRKKNLTNSVSTENVQVPTRKVSSLVLPTSKACSTSLDCSHSISVARKLSLNINGNSPSQRELNFLLPTICITPPVSDSEETPSFSRKFSSAPENAGALGENDFLVVNSNHLQRMTQAKEENWGKENQEMQGVEKEGNACGKTSDVSNLQEQEESEQDWRIDLDCKGESDYDGQPVQTRDSKGQRHRVDKVKTEEEKLDEKLFDENENENSDSKRSTETDAGIYFAVSTFVASGYGEMTVFEGEEVKVVRKAPNGWWMVQIDGESGWMPSNFLMAQRGKQEEDNQESVDFDAEQESKGFSFVEDDGDIDKHGHEDDYEMTKMAKRGKQEEDNQESLDFDAEQESEGFSFVEDDGDIDKHGHEDDYEEDDNDDGDDENTDENDGNFDISSGMYHSKDEGKFLLYGDNHS